MCVTQHGCPTLVKEVHNTSRALTLADVRGQMRKTDVQNSQQLTAPHVHYQQTA